MAWRRARDIGHILHSVPFTSLFTHLPVVVTAYPDHPSFFTSSGERSKGERQEFYRKMNLSVRVHDDELELEIATPAISQSADPW